MTLIERRAALIMAGCLGLLSVACNAAASSSTRSRGSGSQASTPRKDRFEGSIATASGKYSRDSGRAHIYLHPRGSGRVRPVHVVFRGISCAGAPHCLDLNGTLAGTLSQRANRIPDTGTAYSLTASGRITPLGRVRSDGAVQGTGFVMRGRETMNITLRTSSGRVTLHAQSPLVRGFTSP